MYITLYSSVIYTAVHCRATLAVKRWLCLIVLGEGTHQRAVTSHTAGTLLLLLLLLLYMLHMLLLLLTHLHLINLLLLLPPLLHIILLLISHPAPVFLYHPVPDSLLPMSLVWFGLVYYA